MRFSDFCSHAINIHIFENPFSIDVRDAPEKFQLELIDSILYNSFNQEALITFYASLPVSWFSELCKLAQNLSSVFGSTYTCEQTFSCMKQNKFKFHSRITNVHLHNVLQIDISKMEANVKFLRSKADPNFTLIR
jgi:hypothetical protein